MTWFLLMILLFLALYKKRLIFFFFFLGGAFLLLNHIQDKQIICSGFKVHLLPSGLGVAFIFFCMFTLWDVVGKLGKFSIFVSVRKPLDLKQIGCCHILPFF